MVEDGDGGQVSRGGRFRVSVRLLYFLRALAGRCPLCGTRWPRSGRLGLTPQCRTCDVHLERREGDYFLGSYTLNLGGTLLVAMVVTLANVRWVSVAAPIRYGLGLLAITTFALGFYRASKLLWLAVDLQFRPPAEPDFNADSE
jgi:uncharacterized protein (DUF983 family)